MGKRIIVRIHEGNNYRDFPGVKRGYHIETRANGKRPGWLIPPNFTPRLTSRKEETKVKEVYDVIDGELFVRQNITPPYNPMDAFLKAELQLPDFGNTVKTIVSEDGRVAECDILNVN